MDKIQNVVEKNIAVSFKRGILSMYETALDVEKEDDIRYHDLLQKQLFL